MGSDRATIFAAYAAAEDVVTELNGFDYSGLSVADQLDLLSRREKMMRRFPVADHALLAGLQAQSTPKDIGGKNWADVLRIRLHISSQDARRRIRHGEHLGPRTGLSGEVLPPLWEQVARAQAAGALNTEHIEVIASLLAALPLWVDLTTTGQCEQSLVAGAQHQTPEELRAAAKKLMDALDPDGPEPNDDEPHPKRAINHGKQRADGTSEVNGTVDAETRAYWDAINDKWAAPGMCNPADPQPCISGTPTQEQIANDTRTAAQRRHDAYKMVGRMILQSRMLGELNGLPVTVVANATVTDLQRGAGLAITHTGTKLPIRDLIRMAGQGAHHYLTVFDQHSSIPLYLARARRTATPGQRLALFAAHLGCTRPNCPAPASRSQAHHLIPWKHGGRTDITNLTLACGCDNRLADTCGWTTTMGPDGRTHWTPPPLLDVGQPRTNQYHHPTLYPAESGDDDDGENDSPAS
ncbi:DUF222 domain-containing protein [Mycolicibacterium mucogenicum]|uniref:HNH endonuclease signature motif containing protein n=1 Tax=Mycolicibacterium mucogenicum TaxID=56689 RepID=UPI002269E218|nr:HNH endonuclease signature motif containing protein [Mycolicibacterium mucogenicum]MCX8561171.1 DUF222 domain-containing protein [Mycolicibacterium mucogenicum]